MFSLKIKSEISLIWMIWINRSVEFLIQKFSSKHLPNTLIALLFEFLVLNESDGAQTLNPKKHPSNDSVLGTLSFLMDPVRTVSRRR